MRFGRRQAAGLDVRGENVGRRRIIGVKLVRRMLGGKLQVVRQPMSGVLVAPRGARLVRARHSERRERCLPI